MSTGPNHPFGTLEVIRQMSEAEAIAEEDVLNLATYLNEHDGARHSWPGNMLFDYLLNVFEDGNMRSYELDAFARIVEGILIHADGMAAEAARSDTQAISLEAAADGVVLLPDLAHLDEQGVNEQPGLPEMFFAKTMCDCLDWQTARRKLPPNSPGRLCKHLSLGLYTAIGQLPDDARVVRRLVAWAAEAKRALAPQPQWQVVIDQEPLLIAAWGSGAACDIYSESETGEIGSFSYHLVEKQWRFGERPRLSHDERLKNFLADRIAGHAAGHALVVD